MDHPIVFTYSPRRMSLNLKGPSRAGRMPAPTTLTPTLYRLDEVSLPADRGNDSFKINLMSFLKGSKSAPQTIKPATHVPPPTTTCASYAN
jgi:hypothetical protein